VISFLHSELSKDVCKITQVGNFKITQQKWLVKLSHPYASTTIKCFRGSLNVTNRYKKCVTNDNNKIEIDLDAIELVMKSFKDIKAKKEIDKNAANLALFVLMAFIESKLEGIIFSKSSGPLFISYHIEHINHEFHFCWKNYEELIQQDAENLIFRTSEYGKEVLFSKYCNHIDRVKQLQADRMDLDNRLGTYNSQWWNFRKDILNV
jgi:hypothetical protein